MVPIPCLLITPATSWLLNWELNQSLNGINSGCFKFSCLSSACRDIWVPWKRGGCWPWAELQKFSALSKTRTGGILQSWLCWLPTIRPQPWTGLRDKLLYNLLFNILLFKGNKDAKPKNNSMGSSVSIMFIKKPHFFKSSSFCRVFKGLFSSFQNYSNCELWIFCKFGSKVFILGVYNLGTV